MDKETMYTLGMICRAIWPGKGNDISNPPQNILIMATTRPASGLALMLKHPANNAAKQEAVAELVDKLKDIHDPKGGVKREDQGSFWVGYYHYASALDYAKNYGAKELKSAGEALFGERWQTDLAKELDLSDARRIRQWLKGERPIPVGIWADICGLLRQRENSINDILKNLTKLES